MLERLTIQNIALIRNQSIEFNKGLNVLTGETGAGKSLIIDSLSLLLGEKADKSLISRGEKFATVEAVFSDINDKVKKQLVEFGLEEDDSLIITRKISVDGKNECRVNGTMFTLSMLKKITAPLMDLHGQFEHQNLLKVSNHIEILDLYGGKELLSIKNEYVDNLIVYKNVLNELQEYTVDESERERLIELYKFQIEEIDEAAFYVGEEEDLKDFRNQVLHQERIVEALNAAQNRLSGDGYEYNGGLESIKKASSLISSVSTYFKEADEIVNRLDSVKLDLDDIVDSIQTHINNMDFDQEKALINEKRLDLLMSFKKKYGYSIEEINNYREKIENEYQKLVGSFNKVHELTKQRLELEVKLNKVGKELSDKRKMIAVNFKKEVTDELKALGMKSANFMVEFTELSLESLNMSGLDRVEFLFSANLGEVVKPLKNVASGGEMSRFMLAVKNITAKLEGIGTLVFDEIDTGVSGHIALVLAEKLVKVSKMAQIICVTHLAQVASYGKNHLFIEKSEDQTKTTTIVHSLNKSERRNEIARLISGNITESSLRHAEEMLDSGEMFYKSLK